MDDLETVAELEVCGLSVRLIDLLERQGYQTLQDLEQLTKAEFLSWRQAGPLLLTELQVALLNYCTGRQMKTVRQCVVFPPPVRKKAHGTPPRQEPRGVR